MEENISNVSNISQVIIDTINNLLNTLFSSIDNTVYETLDKLAFIDINIFENSFFDKLLGEHPTKSLLLVANSLLVAVCLYYCFKLIYSYFSGNAIEKPYQFIFKLLIFGIFINCSYYVCEFFIYFTDLLSDAIRSVGQASLGKISFSGLIESLNSTITLDSTDFNIFSFDGLLQSIISIGFINLLFTYALRYIMIKVLILITPFAFLTLINASSSWFFKAWLKIFLSLLFVQPFISFILLIIFTLDFSNADVFSQILCIGAMYALVKANSYVQHFISGISTDVSQNFSSLKSKFIQ